MPSFSDFVLSNDLWVDKRAKYKSTSNSQKHRESQLPTTNYCLHWLEKPNQNNTTASSPAIQYYSVLWFSGATFSLLCMPTLALSTFQANLSPDYCISVIH